MVAFSLASWLMAGAGLPVLQKGSASDEAQPAGCSAAAHLDTMHAVQAAAPLLAAAPHALVMAAVQLAVVPPELQIEGVTVALNVHVSSVQTRYPIDPPAISAPPPQLAIWNDQRPAGLGPGRAAPGCDCFHANGAAGGCVLSASSPGPGVARVSSHCPRRKPPFFAVKRPARPYKSAIQNGF